MSIAEKVAAILGTAVVFCVTLAVAGAWTTEVWTTFGIFCGVTGIDVLSSVKLSVTKKND